MWEWFTNSSVWVLIIATIVLIVLFLLKDWILDRLTKAIPEKRRKRLRRNLSIVLWIIEGLIFAVVVLSFVAIVLSQEGARALITTETVEAAFLEHGPKILVILALGVALWYVMKKSLPVLVRHTMVKTKGESKEGIKKRTETLNSVFIGLGRIVIIIIVIFMILDELAIPIAPVLAGFGIAGIAVGFGAQYLIRDLIAGIFIIMENQYRVGDVAKIADIAGLVEEVNLRRTVLRDLDGIVHHVPNGEIRVASNYTRHFSRVNLDVPVAYGTDLSHAMSVINRIGQELAADEAWGKQIINAPYALRVNKWGDSGIDIKILGDVKPMQQWAVMGELRLRLKKAFDDEGIEIPWPHTKVYFGNAPEDVKQ
jgi:small-conductance mechanosensitive channel